MNNILTKIKIDLYSSTSYEVIKAQQGDKNSRIIEFILYNQGEPYEFPDNIFFRFVGHRGDSSSFSKTEEECITRKDNLVSVTLPEDVLYYDGTIEAKLVMYELGDSTANPAEPKLTDKLPERPERTVLSTIPFKISCIKNPCNENNLSEGELSIVTDLIFQMEEFSKNAQDVIDSAQDYATLAQSYAVGGTGRRDNEENDNAMHYYNQTKIHENWARQYSEVAGNCASAAEGSANIAEYKSIEASDYADDASGYAKQAQSYAVGKGNARPNESKDNAKFYYEQVKILSDSFSGALRPMGTVTFANLPALESAKEGDMYNISDQFTTNTNFKEGSKLIIPAGSNVYKTADGKWDILAGTPVTGVKGGAEPETAYHTGNVNLTPENIGAAPTSHASTTTTYGASSATSYGHAMASSTTPKANGTATVGSETTKFARGDHVHPLQTSVATATKATQDGNGNVIADTYAFKGFYNGINFNNIVGAGIYVVTNSANSPDGTKGEFCLIVSTNPGSSGGIWQVAIGSDNQMKIRVGTHGGGAPSFAAWKQLYVEGNLSKSTGIKKEIIDLIYPIGSIYMSVNSTSPATLFGGTWARWGNGRIPVGVDTSQTEFNTVGKTGGEKTHVLTKSEIPGHTHAISAQTITSTSAGSHGHRLAYSSTAAVGGSAARVNGSGTLWTGDSVTEHNGAHTHNVTIPAHTANSNSDGGGAHNNLPPYITCYMWKRTA